MPRPGAGAGTPGRTAPMNFKAFKSCEPVRSMFRGLRMEDILKEATSWSHLQRSIVAFNGCDQGHFVDRVRRRDGTASSGERVLLHAICFMADFAWLADELDTVDEQGRA